MLHAPPMLAKAVIVAMSVVMETLIRAQVYVYNIHVANRLTFIKT